MLFLGLIYTVREGGVEPQSGPLLNRPYAL